MARHRAEPFTRHGERLTSGVNVDVLHIPAGIARARAMGYGSETALMVVTYALQRWARGEEEGAKNTWLHEFPRDLTSFYAIVAAARAGAAKAAEDANAS